MRRLTIIVLILSGCVDPYNPPGLNNSFNTMVVDGYIDLDGTASVKLSRGMPLNVSTDPPVEAGATVTIESSNGEIFPLHESVPGSYAAADLNVDKTSSYVLHVVTDDNDYRSDNVRIHSTPPIDSVYWTINGSNQLQITLDSHDYNSEATGFYVASGIETYEYHAPLNSDYKFINKTAVPRLPNEYVYACWRDVQTSSALATTRGLKKNVISGMILSIINRNSQKISVRYSILAKLRSVSQEEFAFQKRLIASNEQTGTLFSQIPGTIVSNVHSTRDPHEYVLGYFRGQEVKELRYFMDLYTHPLPPGFQVPPSNTCQAETTCRLDIPPALIIGPRLCLYPDELGDDTIITSVNKNNNVVISYNFVTADCGDCRIQGGSTIRPSFW